MSVVRPEYGPTLPELVGPRLATVPRRTRIAVGALLVLLAVAAVAVLVARRDPPTGVVVRDPVAFNLVYDDDALQRVAAPPEGSILALTQRGDRAPMRMVIAPLELPPFRGDSSAALLGLSSGIIEELRRELPGFGLRGEGRFRVNESTVGYQITFQSREEGAPIRYGKRFLLVPATEPEKAPTEGLDVTLLATRSKAIANADAVGANGPLKTPLRSLRFGTDRP